MKKESSNGCNNANRRPRITLIHASIDQYPNKFGLHMIVIFGYEYLDASYLAYDAKFRIGYPYPSAQIPSIWVWTI
jgi:hypothetical protein